MDNKSLATIFIVLFFMLCSCVSFIGDSYSDESVEYIRIQQISDSDMPNDLMMLLPCLGKDSSDTLNSNEGRFLNHIYGIDTTRFNLIGKKVAFLPSYYDKISYFRNALIRHQQGSNYCIGTCALFILNDKQKKECGGYDVVITFWRKIIYSYPKIKYELGCM
ncbi:MAG: hypothetical protein IKN84_07390 [Bacteroidales bacterium]|nr:hypothetical protein [Bacteroidales bacterium]